ncbi:ABC transporter permease [Streptacidiphilus sp. EB103A]|uniref:ABC transporter permease n=1 Tax=Streptacidiphilus sp. EB103A TaxID=3156275 RepID=UPI003513A41B
MTETVAEAGHEAVRGTTETGAGTEGRLRQTWRSLRGSPSAMTGVVLVALHLAVALAAPLLAPASPVADNALDALQAPSAAHLAGTDQYGRDILSRTLYGGRLALSVSLSATVLAVGLGAAVGCLVAYRRGWLDDVVMRVVDAVLSVPPVLALLVIVTVLGTDPVVIVLAVTVVYGPGVVRVVRAAALDVVPRDYVTAARARGEGTFSVLLRDIGPNVLDVVLVEFAMRASWVVLLISSLSFLGFGANPPTPDWGLMVAENRSMLTVAPWTSIAPIIALSTLVIGLNMAADGLAKALGVDRAHGGAA